MIIFEIIIGVVLGLVLGLVCGSVINGLGGSSSSSSLDEYLRTSRPENDHPDIIKLNKFI